MIAQQMLLHFYSSPTLIFDNDVENRYWRKDSFFYNWVWEVWIVTYRRIKLDLYSSLCIKSIQHGLKTELNTETLQLLEGNTSKHFDMGGGPFDSTGNNPNNWQMCLHECIFYTADSGETAYRMRRQPLPAIWLCKEHQNITSKPILTIKWPDELNNFWKKKLKWSVYIWKVIQHSLSIIREMQIKPAMRFCLTWFRMAIANKTNDCKCWWGCGKEKPLLLMKL